MNVLVETQVECPWCGEIYPLMIDTSQGSGTTIEDCTVCCQPILLEVECAPGEIFFVNTNRS